MGVATSTGVPRVRLVSLDALRGFDMFWIMGADALGGIAAAMTNGQTGWTRHVAEHLEHVPWAGFHFYDLIFPLFLFIAGVSLVYSLGRAVEEKGRGEAMVRLFQRGLLLYLLGVLYYGGISKGLDAVRWMGVLQRIAIGYVGAGLCFIHLRARGCAVAWVALMVGYWALLRYVPVPGVGAGNFEEGKNLANWIDSQWLPGRKWDGDHDPEGLLSSMTAVASCLLGTFAGRWMRSPRGQGTSLKATGLVGAGLLMLALGWAWSFEFPIIKKIWTSSFVLVAGGWSCLLFALFHWIIDVRGWSGWCRPLVWVGMNPIAVYLAGRLVDFDLLSQRLVGGPVQRMLNGVWPHLGALVVALVGMGFCFLLAWALDRRKLYLRL